MKFEGALEGFWWQGCREDSSGWAAVTHQWDLGISFGPPVPPTPIPTNTSPPRSNTQPQIPASSLTLSFLFWKEDPAGVLCALGRRSKGPVVCPGQKARRAVRSPHPNRPVKEQWGWGRWALASPEGGCSSLLLTERGNIKHCSLSPSSAREEGGAGLPSALCTRECWGPAG